MIAGADRGRDQVLVLAIRDERLRAVHDVVVAVPHRTGTDPGQIGAGARLGHRHRDDLLAARDVRQPALALDGIGEAGEVRDHDVVGQRYAARSAGHGASAQLFSHDRVEPEIVCAPAAVLLRYGKAEHPITRSAGEQLPVDDSLGIPTLGMRTDMLVDPPSDGDAEGFVLLVIQAETRHAGPPGLCELPPPSIACPDSFVNPESHQWAGRAERRVASATRTAR